MLTDKNVGTQFKFRVVNGGARFDITTLVHASQGNPGFVRWCKPGGKTGGHSAKPAQTGIEHPKADPASGKKIIKVIMGFIVVELRDHSAP
jgi:hypothetical protein